MLLTKSPNFNPLYSKGRYSMRRLSLLVDTAIEVPFYVYFHPFLVFPAVEARHSFTWTPASNAGTVLLYASSFLLMELAYYRCASAWMSLSEDSDVSIDIAVEFIAPKLIPNIGIALLQVVRYNIWYLSKDGGNTVRLY